MYPHLKDTDLCYNTGPGSIVDTEELMNGRWFCELQEPLQLRRHQKADHNEMRCLQRKRAFSLPRQPTSYTSAAHEYPVLHAIYNKKHQIASLVHGLPKIIRIKESGEFRVDVDDMHVAFAVVSDYCSVVVACNIGFNINTKGSIHLEL